VPALPAPGPGKTPGENSTIEVAAELPLHVGRHRSIVIVALAALRTSERLRNGFASVVWKLARLSGYGTQNTMTTVQITLPDQLAQEAQRAGLLAPEKVEQMLREQLRAERIERLAQARRKLAAEPLAPMTPEEIQTEIDAYRTEVRRAAGS